MSKMRAVARYWFVVLLLPLVVGLQLDMGLIRVNGEDAPPTPDSLEASISIRLSTSIPTQVSPLESTLTSASTLSPTPGPTFTPSPTRTPTPSPTPTSTSTPTWTPSPSPTPTATATPTPQPTPAAQGVTLPVPILMYHYLSNPPPGADLIRQDLSVTPAQFESHLAYLRQAGYETISMRDLSYALSQQGELPAKPIILTFDDGYRDMYENAFPLLRRYGYIATFFIFTHPIDEYNVQYLTWEMVIEMHQAGMEFGSHSYRHSDLTGRNVDFLVYEILGSKEAIEARIGEPVRFFSYPSGRYDDLTIRVVESANFWGAVTTQWGLEQSFEKRFEFSRIRIRGSDTAADLAEKLNLF